MTNRATHQNSFDFLRLLAAFLVFHSHQYALSGIPEDVLPWISTTISGLGVSAFFVISGYLVSRSADRSRAPLSFFTNRALRIMPGLTINVVFMVILGAAVTTLPISVYIGSHQVWDFTFRNILIAFNEPAYLLPGVFETNPQSGVNGSLWTLPYEIGFYFVIFTIFFVIKDRAVRTIVILFLATVTALLVITRDFSPDFNPVFRLWNWFAARPLSANGLCFSIGALIYLSGYGGNLRKLLPTLIAVFVIFFFGYTSTISAYILLCYVVLLFGESKLIILPEKIGDISYGLYLYAFPVQQTVINYLGYEMFYTNYFLSLLITLILASISWRYIEKPCLLLKKYVFIDRLSRSSLPIS